MSRLALLSSEPIRERMAGIGIRYLEMARHLATAGVEVVLVSPGDPAQAPELPCAVRTYAGNPLAPLLADCSAVVAQGQLANDVVFGVPHLPTCIDLYDPWLVENLHYAASLGLGPYRNDHASWVAQLAAGDFFLCSSEEQRLFYLGWLTAAGRVNPESVAEDPDLRRLIDVVPFGLPRELPRHCPYLPPRSERRRILFGGLYDWYDPWTLLAALEDLPAPWELYFIANPNPASTPQSLLAEVEHHCRKRNWWESRAHLLPWVPAERRYDLLRDVDLLVAPHRPSLETRLSLRTRFLDALVAGCPIVVSEGGAMSRRVAACDAGWIVPCEDVAALRQTLETVLSDDEERRRRSRNGRALAAELSWDRVLAPLLDFARDPWRDASKERFARSLPTVTPKESQLAPWRRRWRRLRERRRR